MNNIYRENIVEHYKNPENFGNLDNADLSSKEVNLSCGDEIEIFLSLEKNKVKEAKFRGKGCAISQASADILLNHIKGKTLQEINKLEKKDIFDLLGIQLTPSRINCALLPLLTLKKGIENEK
jgi:nitrogen fixation NifU-like protein